MNEVDELRRRFQLLSDEGVPDETRAKIKTMIDQYQVETKRVKKFSARELLNTGGAVVAAMAVFCFVVLRIQTSSGRLTEGTSLTTHIVHSHVADWLPYVVLLGTSGILAILTWILRRGLDTLAYRHPAVRRLSEKRLGIRLYDSVSLQTFIAILFSWILFGVFVRPSSIDLWIGLATLLIFFLMCGSLRYLFFFIFVLLLTSIPAWWVAVEPEGHLMSWCLMVILNVVSFILTPGAILIPARNATLRRLRKLKRGEMS